VHRHADPITIEHIIELRKRVAELERQLNNALSHLVPMRRENERLMQAIVQILPKALFIERKDNGQKSSDSDSTI
jgi:chromosome segregation ATPase